MNTVTETLLCQMCGRTITLHYSTLRQLRATLDWHRWAVAIFDDPLGDGIRHLLYCSACAAYAPDDTL